MSAPVPSSNPQIIATAIGELRGFGDRRFRAEQQDRQRQQYGWQLQVFVEKYLQCRPAHHELRRGFIRAELPPRANRDTAVCFGAHVEGLGVYASTILG